MKFRPQVEYQEAIVLLQLKKSFGQWKLETGMFSHVSSYVG